jgi:hypothetical protein
VLVSEAVELLVTLEVEVGVEVDFDFVDDGFDALAATFAGHFLEVVLEVQVD